MSAGAPGGSCNDESSFENFDDDKIIFYMNSISESRGHPRDGPGHRSVHSGHLTYVITLFLALQVRRAGFEPEPHGRDHPRDLNVREISEGKAILA